VKIDNNLRLVGNGSINESTPKAARNGGTADATGGSRQPVELSPLAAQLQAIEASLSDVPVVDTARVEEIKTAIADGKFTVDTGRIADRLIETARELVNAHRR
jgi:negative regulator of flagellin synthesis FlgM